MRLDSQAQEPSQWQHSLEITDGVAALAAQGCEADEAIPADEEGE